VKRECHIITKSKGVQLKTSIDQKLVGPKKFYVIVGGFSWPTTWPNAKSKVGN